ncbi:MAG: hypothetical protein ACLFNM_03670, partial [Candidatus Woesearchaeota archaeon]
MVLTEERIQKVLRHVVPEEDAARICLYLQGKKNISEFIIAEELDLEIHRTRNILYKLLHTNLVRFKRKKDKIKGWYICYWDFNEDAVPFVEEKIRLEAIDKMKTRLLNEDGNYFYMCRFAHTRQNFEEAFENNFKCPECGEIMNQQDNERTVEFLKSRLDELQLIQKEYLAHKKSLAQTAQAQYEKEQRALRLAEEKAKHEAEEKRRRIEQDRLRKKQEALERKKVAEQKRIEREQAKVRREKERQQRAVEKEKREAQRKKDIEKRKKEQAKARKEKEQAKVRRQKERDREAKKRAAEKKRLVKKKTVSSKKKSSSSKKKPVKKKTVSSKKKSSSSKKKPVKKKTVSSKKKSSSSNRKVPKRSVKKKVVKK